MPRVYFQHGITEAEAQARVKKMKEENKLKPEDILSGVLVLFGPAGELAGDLIAPERADGGYNLEEFPMVMYEYAVNGIKYISNRVRVQDQSRPTMGMPILSLNVIPKLQQLLFITIQPRQTAPDLL